ncbi:MAG: hypothetical protein KHX55_00520 [Proteobacteria bacterium]|nr:hypothetical protein [Pseudomonadota bacterium]
MSNLDELNQNINLLMSGVISHFKENNVSLIMPTYVPQRGEILREFAKEGVKTFIAGGYQNARTFAEVPQKGLPEDTIEYISSFPEHITREIAGAIPEDLLRQRKIALFAYEVDFGWSDLIRRRGLDTEIVSTLEQNQRKYFEEKGNLTHILDAAGLSDYKIPATRVNAATPLDELIEIYDRLKNEDGRVVVQDCCSAGCNTAGKGTLFFDDCETFVKSILQNGGERKVARFIKGYESNLSFFAGNSLPDKKMLGARKIGLTADMDYFNPRTLQTLTANAAAAGINESNIVTIVGRGTLKAVGDEHLTSGEGNGVGNDVGYVYPENIRRQISEIGRKLSRLMALAGHVGLAGADLIIDKTGKIWINEINDRQQGPTAQMSKDAEEHGIPSLLKVSLLSSYADFTRTEVQQAFQSLRQNSAAIHEAYSFNPGEFYLKVHSTHPKGQKQEVRRNLRPGYYAIRRNQNGRWYLNFASYKNPNSNTEYQTNPDKGEVVVKITGGDWKSGDKVDNGSQLFRITGVANPGNPPFAIEDGKTVLNKTWRPVVAACYDYMFGEGYTRQNPLWQKRNSAKNIKIAAIVQSLRSR